MASILKTDKIEGVTSSGTVQMPAGHVVQVLQGERLTIQAVSSNTYADVVTQAITPDRKSVV